ncbi:MAG TPA: aspartate:alanine exchanger family transporter [Anaerolineae bacterium]|nr:aspartate:alanine exchanger family transporter [Anaerolineae bacterium]
MIQLLIDNPLLLLFVVAAIGYPLGRIKIGGSSLGVAAVLFVGLAIGSLHPDLKLPELVYQLGLVIFVYTIGLSSGPVFFASFRRKGLRDNLFVVGMLVLAAAITVIVSNLLQFRSALAAGVYTGSLTNTAALAGVLEYIKSTAPRAALDQLLAEPVVGFSITYPAGAVGMILLINVMQHIWKIDYAAEAPRLRDAYAGATNKKLDNRTIRVTRPEAAQATIQELIDRHKWDVIFGRMKRAGQLSLADGQTRLNTGDLVSVIGTPDDLDRVIGYLGEASDERLELDRREFDHRRIFVSNPKVAGHRLRDLNLPQQFGAIVTRVRRGDIEMLAHDDTVLELGDRVRVVTQRKHMDAVSAFFGDSYRALSEIDILTFSLGLGLGLLLGMVPIPLPGGIVVKLGLAGGPLVVSLILGTLGRTGSMVWSLPYSANLTLRQAGLILFLAGVGTRAGYAFVTTITQGGGASIFTAGIVITVVTAVAALWIGRWLLKIPMGLLMGVLAGLQTQPAVLGFALEQTRNDLPNIGYAAVYPVALITKILLAQLLLALLR